MKRIPALHRLPATEQQKNKVAWTKTPKQKNEIENESPIIPSILQDAKHKANVEATKHDPICQCVICLFKKTTAYRETKTEKKRFIVEEPANVQQKGMGKNRKRT
jgi:hypothetical protein